MVREMQVFISTATDPDFASNYYVTAYEVGAQVTSGSSGTSITVRAGHGFAANDKFFVNLDLTKYRTVLTVGATTLTINSAVSVSAGDVLVNLAQDSGTIAPNYDGAGITVYTDMDFSNAAVNNTIQLDSQGKGRYYHRGIPIWELVRSSLTVPFAVNQGVVNEAIFGIGTGNSTDNAVVRWDGTGGATLQNSVVIVSDAGVVTGVSTLTATGAVIVGSLASSGPLSATATTVSTLHATGAATLDTSASVATTLTVGSTLTVTGACAFTSGAVTDNWTFGNASTDTYAFTGRMIVRTVTVDPTGTTTAGTTGEIVFSSNTNKFYGKHTTTASDLNWRLLGT